MRIYNQLLNLGQNPAMDSYEFKYIRLTNFINLSLIFFISIPAILTIKLLTNMGLENYIRFILVIMASSLIMLLNHYKKYSLAKILTLISPFFCIFLFPVINGFYWEGYFLWFPYGIMVIGATAFYIFSYEKEKTYLNIMIAFFALATLFYDGLLEKYAPHHLDLSFIYEGKNYLTFTVAKVIILFFLYISLYTFKINYHKQRIELINLNQSLDSINKKLNMVNSAQEDSLKEKELKLKVHDQKFSELAFIKARRIRVNIARISALVNSKNWELSEEEKNFCDKKIKESLTELDQITGNAG